MARNLGALLGGQAITWTVTLAWTVVVPRALGPVGLGVLVSAQSVSGVLGIVLGMGTRNYLVREAVTNPVDGPQLVGTALVLRIATAPLVGIAAVVWAWLAGDGHQAALVLYLITAMTVLTLITEPLQAAFQAIERMKYLAYADIINKSAQSLIGIALVLAGFNVVGIAANMAIIAVVVLVLTSWWLRPHFAVDMRTSLTLMGDMVRQSMAYWAFGLFGMVYFWIDTIMLSLMTRPQVVGWYGVTSQLFQTLMFLPVLIQTAWLPRLVAAFASGHRELTRAARAPVELILAISAPIAVAMALVADPLIHVVYGSGFSHAVPVMVILAFCVPPIYVNIILASVLLAAKRQRVWTIVMAGAAVINPLLNLVLIPLTEHRYHNGAIGASVALVLTEVLMDVVGFFMVGRDIFDGQMIRRCGLVCVASAAMAGAAYATRRLGAEISLPVAFATFGVLVLALRIVRQEELALVRTALRRVRRGRAHPPEEPAAEPWPSGEEAFVIERSLPAGHVNAAMTIARRLELDQLLDPAPSHERDLCMAMIIGRVIDAASPLGGVGVMSQTTLAGELGVVDADEADLDAAIDWLLDRRDGIEAGLAERHLAGGVPVLYEVPVGDADLMCGMLCDSDGRPVAVASLTGRHDLRALRSQVARLKRRFELPRVVVVASAELFARAGLERLPATAGIDWITALEVSAIETPEVLDALQRSAPGERDTWEVPAMDQFPDERLIGCCNRPIGAERSRRRGERLSATEAELAAIAARVDHGGLWGIDRIWLAVGPALNRHRMRTYFQVSVSDQAIAYTRDTAKIAAAETMDGVTVIRTSLAESAASARQVARLHRNLARAGLALGGFENPDVERLPIHQGPEDCLHAHALICMLAYNVSWHLRSAWKPLLCDDDGRLIRSYGGLMADLATQTRNTTRLRQGAGTVERLTRPTALQAKALELAAHGAVGADACTPSQREGG